ncbi:hypothetical protein T4D_14904 [Trichinella pseudospiralis]|uniref:Uncharacterized protein n=1 Tax=Trichinella pseudospiralis TaxID=6337 RepID=A0A0V1FUL6_TRIPS|nr:hypothetical protein T4D_14904 [Trichinella pseudospiralis]
MNKKCAICAFATLGKLAVSIPTTAFTPVITMLCILHEYGFLGLLCYDSNVSFVFKYAKASDSVGVCNFGIQFKRVSHLIKVAISIE